MFVSLLTVDKNNKPEEQYSSLLMVTLQQLFKQRNNHDLQ